jgi:hypothetical protein
VKWTPISRLALVAALVVAGVIGTASYGVASAKACGLFSNCTVTVHVTGQGIATSTVDTGGQTCQSALTTPTGQEGNTCIFTFGWGWIINLDAQWLDTEGWHFKQWSGSGFAKPVHCEGEDSATNTLASTRCHFWLWDNLDIRAEFVDTTAPDTTLTSAPSGYQQTTSATFRFASSDRTPSTFMCSLDEAVSTPCTSPATYSGLAQGSHTLRVRAFDPSGNGDPSPALAQWAVDSVPPQNPTLTPNHNPGSWSSNPVVAVAFNGAQDGFSGIDGYSYAWDQSADTVPATVKNAEETATGTSAALADGLWYFHLRTVDNAGNWSSPTTIGPFKIDRTPPSGPAVSVPSPAPNTTFTVGWKAADAVSGVASYDVRFRSASAISTGTFGSYFPWRTATHDLSAPFTAVPGSTYCFSARAYDAAGNSSNWSGERCTAVPLDDPALSSVGVWTRTPGSGYYLGTVSRATATGARLSARLAAKRLIVLVTKCPTCGTIDVLYNGVVVVSADLAAATTQKQQRVTLPAFAQVQTGLLSISVTSSSRPVEVDGVVAAPT